MAQNEGNWPGKVEDYRQAKAAVDQYIAEGHATADGVLVAMAIREGFAGLSQILDKVAYAARQGGTA